MLMVKIKHRKTGEIIEVTAAGLQEYCKTKNWEYHIIKQYFNRNVHYADRHFFLYENEQGDPLENPLAPDMSLLASDTKILEPKITKDKKTRRKKKE